MEAGSLTAKIAAACRAKASARVDPICNDPWAKHLVGEEGNDILAPGLEIAPEMEEGMAVRTAWLDALVGADAAPQVVLLGAGLDTRPARLARADRRFFEVDHPKTQAHKRQRLDAIPTYPQEATTFVSCDFERDDFAAALLAAGFRRDVASAFVWEGVIAYLTEAAVRTTFRSVASLGAHAIFFDYIGPPIGVDRVGEFADERGEPFIFTPDDVRPLLHEAGFPDVNVVSMRQAHQARTARLELAPFFERWFLVEAAR